MRGTTLPARGGAQLTVSGLRVVRGGRAVLDGVDLTLTPDSRLGVVGENGRGKTTLLQVLAGRLAPDDGEVSLMGSVGVADQELDATGGRTVGDLIEADLADVRDALHELDAAAQALADDRPGADTRYDTALAVAETLDVWDADRRTDVALEALGAGTDRGRELGTLSVGQRYRVRLAGLLGAQPQFLLLDEPTNHLDRAGLDFLTDRLRSARGGVVVVSHDRALLADVAEQVLDLDPSVDGAPRLYGGGYAGYRAGREAERQRWADEYRRQQGEQARLADDLSAAQNRLSTGWRPDKGTGKHQRQTRAPGLVRAVHRRQEDLQRHAVSMPPPPQPFSMPELPARPGVLLLRGEGLSVPGRLAGPVDLALSSGDRLVVEGPNGAGKSTLLGLLAGRLEPSVGTVHRARRGRVALLGQESPPATRQRARELFDRTVGELVGRGELELADEVSLGSLGLLPTGSVDRPVRELSTGQQRRLDLALVLARRPHVLLLDEPTNHLSVALVDELTEALGVTAAAVVVATHDRQLLRDLAAWPRLTLGTPP